MEIIEDDVGKILDNIMASPVKKNRNILGGKKIPSNIFVSPMDKVYFRYEESMLKWKYMYHRRIALERELSKEALK